MSPLITSTASAGSRVPGPLGRLEVLLVGASHGDALAYEDFYDAVAPRVYGLVLRILRDVQQSEEVTQEVLIELWKTSTRFDPARGSALSWVMTMAHRRAIDCVRSTEAWRRRDTKDAVLSRTTPVDETADGAQASLEAQTVRAALAKLTHCQRQALELAYFGGHTHTEVSELLDVPLGTAKSRIRDGLLRLRAILTPTLVTASMGS